MLNPILKIEWLIEGRNIRLPIMIVFYNAILAFVTILFMLFNAESLQEGYYYDTSSYLYQFLIISSLQILAVFILMPFFVSGLYTVDRDKHMMEQFAMIPGVAKQFVIAKILLVLSMNGLLFISGLPIITLSCIYTGMSWLKIVRLGVMVLVYSFWSGSIAIFFYSICKKIIWAFAGTIFSQMMFTIGTILAAELFRNGAVVIGGAEKVPTEIAVLCLVLMVLNPLSSYMGYYGNLTGDTGLVTAFCGHLGVDATEKLFSLVFYKISSLMCILVGAAFLWLSIWYLNRNQSM